MENEKPYARSENFYFWNNSDIKNCFLIIYNNCLETSRKWTWKNTEGFYVEQFYS